jgi:Flp pilus assembly protein protease CpaA
VLLADFIPYAALTWKQEPILLQLALALLTFAFCLAFWRFQQIGGGDVKFISVLALWMHPESIGIFFLLLAFVSMAFIAILRWGRQWNAYFQESPMPALVKTLISKSEQQVIPYGVPAAISALAVKFLVD